MMNAKALFITIYFNPNNLLKTTIASKIRIAPKQQINKN